MSGIPPSHIIYSISEKECDSELWRGDQFEKIGSTNDLSGRLYEHNNASVLIPYVYGYYFKITDLQGRTRIRLEKEIHVMLDSRHINMGCGIEFFAKDPDKPSYQLIREYLDCNDIRYEFVHENDILPERRRTLSQYLCNFKPNSTELRDYQLQAHSLMNIHSKYTFIFPAGTGKGITYESYIEKYRCKYLILVPNKNLVTQTCRRLASRGIQTYSYIESIPNELPENYVIVSTYHSSKQFEDIEFDAIHYDEAHRTVISIKNDFSPFQYIIKNSKAKKLFFWTATPKFLTGNSEIISMDRSGYFGEKYELPLDEAIEKGYICDYIVRINSARNIKSKIINIFADKLTKPWKAVIFFDRMDDADNIRDFLRKNLEGYNIYSYHSRSKDEKILQIFGKNKRCILCVCDMMSLGYDQPDIDTIIHYNMTSSPILNTQRNGRGQRISPNKQCNSIYYFINKLKDINVIITQLSEQDKRLLNQYTINATYNKTEESHSGIGKLACIINIEEPIELTREMLRYFSREEDSKTRLQHILKYRNRHTITCIDKQQVTHEYGILFSDLKTICESIENFPRFCLGYKRYNEYISSFVVDTDKIYDICKREKIYTDEEYKIRSSDLNLPSYEFILNGGIMDIKNLTQFLPKKVYEEN